jgi:hypothetical protein
MTFARVAATATPTTSTTSFEVVASSFEQSLFQFFRDWGWVTAIWWYYYPVTILYDTSSSSITPSPQTHLSAAAVANLGCFANTR